jgi:hypothetical protein
MSADWYRKNKERHKATRAAWRSANRQKDREWNVKNRAEVKLEVLSHYGPDGKVQCSWNGCTVIDPDMLSLDHVNNDGCNDSRGTGSRLYQKLKNEQFPSGFQTLCHNHQWKKELMRRREE